MVRSQALATSLDLFDARLRKLENRVSTLEVQYTRLEAGLDEAKADAKLLDPRALALRAIQLTHHEQVPEEAAAQLQVRVIAPSPRRL